MKKLRLVALALGLMLVGASCSDPFNEIAPQQGVTLNNNGGDSNGTTPPPPPPRPPGG